MTLLSIVQDACTVVGLDTPSAVVGGSDQNAARMFSLCNREGRELARRFDWQMLQVDHTFAAVATENQGTLPTDFDHFIDDTFWNRSERRPVLGPVSPEEWQALEATSVPAVSDVFRIITNTIRIKPTPRVGDTYAYTYITKNWCQSSGGAGQTAFATDLDTALLSEEVITLGLVWRFLQSVGMEYGEARATYERAVAREMARDGGRTAVRFGDPRPFRPGLMVPEGDWAI